MSDAGYIGDLDARSDTTPFHAIDFLVRQRLSRIVTSTLVKVVAVTNSGGVSPVGTVDVQPLVHQIDGAGKPTPHGVIHNLPYVRVQGGANAIIMDPAVGDIGFAGFCSTDISSAKANAAPANPGSRRRFDWADGVYLGGVPLQTTPTTYIQFKDGDVTIVSPGTITIQAPTVAVTGDLTVSGTSKLTGDVTMSGTATATDDVTGESISLHSHYHTGVQTGSGNTGGPV
jgi:phage baseplate assembly protein gpV